MYAVSARAGFRGVTRDQATQAVTRYFQRLGAGGGGSIELEDAQALGDRYRYKLQLQGRAGVADAGGVRAAAGVPTEAGVALSVQANDEVSDDGELACTSGYSQRSSMVEFAAPAKVVADAAECRPVRFGFQLQGQHSSPQHHQGQARARRHAGADLRSRSTTTTTRLMQKV